jgi:hypothetical protein
MICPAPHPAWINRIKTLTPAGYLLVKSNGTKAWRLAYRYGGEQKPWGSVFTQWSPSERHAFGGTTPRSF